jgi:TorA maturation chaperone TorD
MAMNFETFKESLFTLTQTTDPVVIETDTDNQWDRSRLDVESAFALKNIFFYLGIIFRYPTEQIYSEIEEHLEAFADFFSDYGGAVPKLPPIDDLQSEYISLFVTNKGFVPAAPYASCYQGDGMLMSDNFYRLKQIMMESGFMMDTSVKELEDHVAVLLEFCSSLLNTLVVKNNSSDINFQACIYALMEISYRYIEPWIDVFTDKINSYANYDFYKVAGKALKSLFHDADAIYIQLLGFRNNSTNELQG